MPLEIIPAKDALATRRTNKFNRWPRPNVDQERLSPIARPTAKPSFSLVPGEKVFTIGSCFARNIERHLDALGFDIPTKKWKTYRQLDHDVPSEFLNKYVTHSIHNELLWSLDPATPFPGTDALVEVSSEKWFDPHSTPTVPLAPLEIINRRRRKVQEITADVVNCRVVVITLGLVEAWYDRELDIYLNAPPPWSFLSRNADRYELHVLEYNEILESLRNIHDVLTKFGHPDFKILITVSPVPLVLTFTNQDVLQANMYSKSVLRAAAEAFVGTFENVDYFPSYESISLSERSAAWEADNRHVQSDIVGVNIASMANTYLPEDDQSNFHFLLNIGKAYAHLGRRTEAADYFLKAKLINSLDPTLNHEMGVLYFQMGDYDAANDFLQRSETVVGSSRFWRGLSLHRLGRFKEAVICLDLSIKKNSGWAPAYYHKAKAQKELGDLIGARASLERSIEIKSDFEEATTFLAQIL